MAQEDAQQDDRTEEATPERREEWREKGQLVVSRELTSVFVLAAAVLFLSFMIPVLLGNLERMFVVHFESLSYLKIDADNVLAYALSTWREVLYVVIPFFLVTLVASASTTFFQTRFNWSWKKLKPDFSRMNVLKGLARLVSMQALVELLKGIGKMSAVGLVAWLILRSEWAKVPELMVYPVTVTWGYWASITKQLFWAVAGLLLIVAGFDYSYNYVSYERKIKMTRQEVKEEFKKREVDPHLKGRMRRMARELATRKVLATTKEATVLITNPTHYSIALKYELGMAAPVVLTKGIDFVALRMREIAKELDIPIIENRPLARELYATVEDGEEIPVKLYRIVSEVIRYVFRLKGRALPRKDS